MAQACVYISVYIGVFDGARNERVCAVRTLPYADMADVDAVCGIWDTDREYECESEEVVADGAGAGGRRLFGMELVQAQRKGDDLIARRLNMH